LCRCFPPVYLTQLLYLMSTSPSYLTPCLPHSATLPLSTSLRTGTSQSLVGVSSSTFEVHSDELAALLYWQIVIAGGGSTFRFLPSLAPFEQQMSVQVSRCPHYWQLNTYVFLDMVMLTSYSQSQHMILIFTLMTPILSNFFLQNDAVLHFLSSHIESYYPQYCFMHHTLHYPSSSFMLHESFTPYCCSLSQPNKPYHCYSRTTHITVSMCLQPLVCTPLHTSSHLCTPFQIMSNLGDRHIFNP
jgi:hypothetical protein